MVYRQMLGLYDNDNLQIGSIVENIYIYIYGSVGSSPTGCANFVIPLKPLST